VGVFSPLDARSESYIPDVLLVLLRGVSVERRTCHTGKTNFSRGLTPCFHLGTVSSRENQPAGGCFRTERALTVSVGQVGHGVHPAAFAIGLSFTAGGFGDTASSGAGPDLRTTASRSGRFNCCH